MSSSALDDEIVALQARVNNLKSRLRIQTATLLSEPAIHALLIASPEQKDLLGRAAAQRAHNQQNLYRACAGITTFRARDPDPCAVDSGAILGLRVEVVSRAKFLRPYYVLFNRPFPDHRSHLRVHRHTVPPCVPLAGLASRYLPRPGKGQDLARFAKALRKEVVRYHHRMGAIADLRKAAGLGRSKKEADQGEEDDAGQPRGKLVDITAADAEAKQITIEWADGRTGRLVMGDDGDILNVVAVGEGGRDRGAVRELLGGAERVEDVAKRLASR